MNAEQNARTERGGYASWLTLILGAPAWAGVCGPDILEQRRIARRYRAPVVASYCVKVTRIPGHLITRVTV